MNEMIQTIGQFQWKSPFMAENRCGCVEMSPVTEEFAVMGCGTPALTFPRARSIALRGCGFTRFPRRNGDIEFGLHFYLGRRQDPDCPRTSYFACVCGRVYNMYNVCTVDVSGSPNSLREQAASFVKEKGNMMTWMRIMLHTFQLQWHYRSPGLSESVE
eukprot:gb/GECG01013755.1/.p1 GENE.gb/GECG01013755.1/~~gb/GECG01013755.1/.p1  ORF type:complete len:159 (+),score=4.07 gb/GECG01013755.1/:1-477(+)